MTSFTLNPASESRHWRAGVATLAVLAMTVVHHAWGAVIYAAPFRLHVVFVAVPVAVAIAVALQIGARQAGTRAGRLATWIGIAASLVFAVAMIGFFEGGYNHVAKNVVFFIGGEAAVHMLVLDWLVDPSLVEIPNDFLFEATGIAQFPLGIWAAIETWRLARHTAR